MKISFAGHSMISINSGVKEIVKEQIRVNIKNEETITCYLGGYGEFDAICASACKELREEYNNIEIIYVTPYMNFSAQEIQCCDLYDAIIYPPIENVPLRFAISKRNEWMMINADIIIAFVNRDYGGAYKSLQIAKRRR